MDENLEMLNKDDQVDKLCEYNKIDNTRTVAKMKSKF